MTHMKLYNFILIFLCITSSNFSVLSESPKLSELEDAINKSISYTTNDNLSYSIKLDDLELFLYGYFVPSTATKEKTDMNMNIFYMYMNCSFAEWLQGKLFNIIEMFQSKFKNVYDSDTSDNEDNIVSLKLIKNINFNVRDFISCLLQNFLHLAHSRDSDTSLLKTILLLQIKIHFFTPTLYTKQLPSDNIVVRSILEIMNLIQMFMATNCDVHTYNKTHFINDEYFIKSSNFFVFRVTKSAYTDKTIAKLYNTLSELRLFNRHYFCYKDQMLLINIVTETTDHLVLREISHAEVFFNSKTIKIYKLLQKIEKRECDLELIFWYQESIFDAIVKLIYSKMITALQQENPKPEQIVKSIPQFIELPTDVTDYFMSQTYYDSDKINKLIEKITDLRKSITNIILETVDATENQKVSELNEFTAYMDSKSGMFYCYISVRNFLRKEFTKYYIPFIRNLSKVEHFVFEDMPIDEIVRSDVDDKLTNSRKCQYVRDLYGLCLKATTSLKMIVDKHNFLVSEYTKQVNTILTTIRKRSTEVIERCMYEGCRDLLKVSYHIYTGLNPVLSVHNDNFKTNQALMFMSMIMPILNIYGIDHCSSPEFNFRLLNSKSIDHDDVINERLNSFVQSLEVSQNVSIVKNYSTFLNIDNFFKTYLVNTVLFDNYKQRISFFYKGERKYIDEIYKNISEIIMDPSHVFKFYDIYFKFILGSVFYEVYVYVKYLEDNPESNRFELIYCKNFHHKYTMLLNAKHFPANLSILVSYVDRFSTLAYDICNQKAEKAEHDDEKETLFDLYLKVGILKKNKEKQFEKFGMFITNTIEGIPKTMTSIEDFFLVEKTCELIKDANNMLTELIINI